MIRVLVIDDQPQVRSTISIALESEQFTVVTVESGTRGVQEFGNADFDLVIVDIYMPGLDGPKTIKALREIKPGIPVVAISGVLLKSSNRTALDFLPLAPAFADVVCLQKPFRQAQLIDAVQKATGMVVSLHFAKRKEAS